MKIRLVGAQLFHEEGRADGHTDRQTGRQTDMTTPIVVFRNSAKASKNRTCGVNKQGLPKSDIFLRFLLQARVLGEDLLSSSHCLLVT